MNTLYILPTITNKKITLEYRLAEERRDMRKVFCKKHESEIYSGSITELFEEIQSCNAKVKADRLIMPDGKAAYSFQKWLESHK